MKKGNTVNETTKAMPYDALLYTVHVICWDGVEYTREATKRAAAMF